MSASGSVPLPPEPGSLEDVMHQVLTQGWASIDLGDVAARIDFTQQPAAVAWDRVGDWIVEPVDGCTCAGGSPYGHEPGCGVEPIMLAFSRWPRTATHPDADGVPW